MLYDAVLVWTAILFLEVQEFCNEAEAPFHPTYKLEKKLNNVTVEYIPQEHSIKNLEELLQFLRTSSPQGRLASPDVVSSLTSQLQQLLK